MKITSKYPGKCSECGDFYDVGDEIEWEPAEGTQRSRAWHLNCVPPQPQPRSAARTRVQGKLQAEKLVDTPKKLSEDLSRELIELCHTLPLEYTRKLQRYYAYSVDLADIETLIRAYIPKEQKR